MLEHCIHSLRLGALHAVALASGDLERRFGLIGGDIFHGALTLDQPFSARPIVGHADYRAPLAGLYMCSSGTHPVGGIASASGHNAARALLADSGRCRFRKA